MEVTIFHWTGTSSAEVQELVYRCSAVDTEYFFTNFLNESPKNSSILNSLTIVEKLPVTFQDLQTFWEVKAEPWPQGIIEHNMGNV